MKGEDYTVDTHLRHEILIGGTGYLKNFNESENKESLFRAGQIYMRFVPQRYECSH